MGLYRIIVSHGNFTNTVVEWCGSHAEAVERAKDYCEWLGCEVWKVVRVAM